MKKKQDSSNTSKTSSARKWADALTISINSSQGGIELRFNAEPSPELQPKLRAMGFRHSKSQVMWYGENTERSKQFAELVEAALPTSPDGPDLILSPSFDAVKTNIEKKEFSYVMITLKDGQVKNYVVFEPSKPKAEVIASNFAKNEFGDAFLALAAKPRLHTKEARVLFDEGKIIYPEGQSLPVHKASIIKGVAKEETPSLTQEMENDNRRELETVTLQKFYNWATLQPDLSSKPSEVSREVFEQWLKDNYPQLSAASIDNIWRSHERIMKSFKRFEKRSTGKPKAQPYSAIYKKLMQIIPNLLTHIEAGKDSGKSVKDHKGGLMDLNFDYLGKDKKGNYLIALSHLFEQNGDMVPDPDMQIRIIPDMEIAEALTFQDQFGYQEVYPDKGDGKEYVNLKRKKDLNQFLSQWLTNIIKQGHKIDLTQEESETEVSEVVDDSSEKLPFSSPESERFFTADEEQKIIEQFLAQGFTRPFSAQEAIDKNLPVIDLAFRYTEPMEYFRDHIENPRKKKIQELREELKDLKAEKGVNDQKNSLKEQAEQLEAEMTYAEKLVYDEGLIFQDDLYAIILQKAKQRGYAKELSADTSSSFRDYVITNILDNRAIENYHKDPVQIVVSELMDEYFNSKEENDTSDMKPKNQPAQAIKQDIKSGDVFVPNILEPVGTTEPFLSQSFQLFDMKAILQTNFPHLLKINEKNLSKAPALALFELLQLSHPTEYGIDVGRVKLLAEWEARGKQVFEEIGFPTDDNYPYVNIHLGYESVETLASILFDNNTEGNEWWAVAEHCRPIADAKRGLEIIDGLIKKENKEKEGYINPKTGKPKLEFKHLVKDVELTIENLEDSQTVIQNFVEDREKKIKKETKDVLTNDSGVYTEKTAGKNYEVITIPMPKSAKYGAEIRLAKTSKGDYRKGISCAKKFGDSHGGGYAPSEDGEAFTTRQDALASALKEIYERLQYDIKTKDSILGNEDNKLKSLNAAMAALQEFALENDVTLNVPPAAKKSSTALPVKETDIIKGLEDTYWTKDDNKYPVNKALINGMEFNQSRLRDAIGTKLEKLPIALLEEMVKELSLKFQERRPLATYEKSLVTIGKTGNKRKATLIASYVDDMVVDHDLKDKEEYPVLTFLIELLFKDEQKLVDLPQHIEKTSTPKVKKQSQYDLNKEIETFIDKKDQEKSFFNEEEKNFIRQYTGSGGLINQGASGRGILYEYYTTENVVKRMWDMAYHFGYDGGSVLEPSVGTGNFLKYAPKGATVFGFETNHYSARIAQILYPNAQIYEKAFETLFFAGNVHLKDEFDHVPYSLVIGNPPYGEFSGKYAGMGEKKWTGAAQYEHYFTLRGLDLLKSGGLLIYIVPSNFLRGASYTNIAKKIAAKCEGLDRYTLGSGIFKTTDIETDVIALRKK